MFCVRFHSSVVFSLPLSPPPPSPRPPCIIFIQLFLDISVLFCWCRWFIMQTAEDLQTKPNRYNVRFKWLNVCIGCATNATAARPTRTHRQNPSKMAKHSAAAGVVGCGKRPSNKICSLQQINWLNVFIRHKDRYYKRQRSDKKKMLGKKRDWELTLCVRVVCLGHRHRRYYYHYAIVQYWIWIGRTRTHMNRKKTHNNSRSTCSRMGKTGKRVHALPFLPFL